MKNFDITQTVNINVPAGTSICEVMELIGNMIAGDPRYVNTYKFTFNDKKITVKIEIEE